MKIFLIQPKTKGANFKSPPLGLQILATVLKNHGYANIYDIDPDKGDNPYTVDYSGKDVLVGITVTFMTISEAFRLAKFIKSRNYNAKIVFGGPHVTLMPEESITDNNVDIIVIGEGEETIVEVADSLRGGESLEGIKGIWYKNEKDEIVKNELRAFIKDLDSIPYSDRTFFTDRKYQTRLIERLLAMPTTWHLMSARSCPFTCKMCQPAMRKIAGPWRQRSVGNVINEIKYLQQEFNARYFSFYDNDIGINKKWIIEFCQELKKIKKERDISLSCLGRANLLDYELLKLMKESGFDAISIGAESGNNRVLKEIMDKKTTVQNIIDFVNNCYRLKIRAGAFWMMASPGETLEEMEETIDLASELPVFYCHFHIATPNPGTQYYLDALHGGYLNMKSWDDVHDRRNPTIIKDNVTAEDIARMDEYLIKTMVKKGWNYRLNGHTLSFINTRLFAKHDPLNVLGREIWMFLEDFKPYHFRNIYLGAKCIFGIDKSN